MENENLATQLAVLDGTREMLQGLGINGLEVHHSHIKAYERKETP